MKSDKLSIRIKPNVKNLLLEQADKENRTLSNYVNMILENHVKNNKGDVENE